MLNILRTNQPFVFIVSGWSIMLLHLIVHFNDPYGFEGDHLFFNLIGILPKFLFYVLIYIVVFFTAFYINVIINRSVLFPKSFYLPGLLYIVLMSCFDSIEEFALPIVANLFLVFALGNLLKIFRNESCKNLVFKASLHILISSVFFSLNIFLIPLIWVVLFIIRPFKWREYVMPIVTLIVLSAYVVPFGIINKNLSAVLMTWWETGLISYFESTNLIMQLFTGFVAITFILSIRPIARTFLHSNNRFKRVVWVVIAMLICTLLLCVIDLLIYNRPFGAIIPFFVPLAIFLSNGFIRSKYKWLCDGSLVLFIMGVFITHFV